MVRNFLKRLLRSAPRVGYFDVFDAAQLRPLLDRHGIPWPTAVAALKAARTESARPGEVVRRILESRLDLRTAFPLGSTPLGRAGMLEWLLTHGHAEYALTATDALRFTAEQALDPSDGFADAYRWQPAWQAAVPDALTPVGWPKLLAWLADAAGPAGPWLDRVPPPAFPVVAARGVNVLGHFGYPSGLQEEADQYVRALHHAGCAVARRDIPDTYRPSPRGTERYDDLEVYPVSLVKIGAAELLDAQYAKAGLHPRAGVYRVACWSWELASFPPEPVAHAGLADEVWTPSEFAADAVRRAWPGQRVTAVLPGASVPAVPAFGRSHFGLDPGRFVVAFAFDMGSSGERKNPLGLLRAFGRAFPGEEPATLVIKASRAEANPTLWAALQLAAAADPRVVLLNRVMPRDEATALLAACDCYCSLHRAEGFGYTLAEAMLLGKPTIATDYSGNLDFMTPETSHLVRYTPVKVGPGLPPYDADAEWAEPDESHAAELLRRVYADPEAARALGARAAEHARGVFSVEAAAARMEAALASRKR